jgi:hypothetical protein
VPPNSEYYYIYINILLLRVPLVVISAREGIAISFEGCLCTKKVGEHCPVANFTNILRTAFALIFFLPKKLQIQTVCKEKLPNTFN